MLTINVMHNNKAEGIADLNSEITIKKSNWLGTLKFKEKNKLTGSVKYSTTI
jgi:hypothetical protein